jgi:hypothetical protein
MRFHNNNVKTLVLKSIHFITTLLIKDPLNFKGSLKVIAKEVQKILINYEINNNC